MSTFPTSSDGRRWVDGFRVGDRVTYYGRPGTIVSYHPPSSEIHNPMEMEPEYWGVKIDNGEVSYGYINEFDFLV